MKEVSLYIHNHLHWAPPVPDPLPRWQPPDRSWGPPGRAGHATARIRCWWTAGCWAGCRPLLGRWAGGRWGGPLACGGCGAAAGRRGWRAGGWAPRRGWRGAGGGEGRGGWAGPFAGRGRVKNCSMLKNVECNIEIQWKLVNQTFNCTKKSNNWKFSIIQLVNNFGNNKCVFCEKRGLVSQTDCLCESMQLATIPVPTPLCVKYSKYFLFAITQLTNKFFYIHLKTIFSPSVLDK